MSKIMTHSKNILLIGAFSTRQYTYASSFHRVITEMEYDVQAFDYRRKFVELRSLNISLMNYRLKKTVRTFKPDLVFIIKGETIRAKTLHWIKSTSPKTILINFYPDNPFVLWNGNSNQEVLISLPCYDYFLSWSQMLMSVLESAGCKNVLYFPFAYDETVFNNNPIISDHKHYACDVSFVGTWDAEREWWLTGLITARPHLDLAIWGNNWLENLAQNSLLRPRLRDTAIYPPESVNIIQNSMINLNFIRKQNMTSHNMRTFEITSSGGFMLTQRTREQAEIFFKEDESLACFDTLDELIKKIDFYLKQPSIRKAVMHNSTTVAQHYTLQNYIKNLFKKIIWREDEHSNETKDCDTYYSQLL
jgi:spore maturation protein CgeB